MRLVSTILAAASALACAVSASADWANLGKHPARDGLTLAIGHATPALPWSRAPLTESMVLDDTRIVVRTAEEMPHHDYPVTGPALDLIKDDARFAALVDAFLSDTLADLRTYRIEDSKTLKELYRAVCQAYLVKGQPQMALEYAEKSRALETKDSSRHMIGPSIRARIAAERAAGTANVDDAKYREVFRETLRAEYARIPPDVARELFTAIRASAQMSTVSQLEAGIAATMDPLIEQSNGRVPFSVARSLIDLRDALFFRVRVASIAGEVCAELLAEDGVATQAEDRWAPRVVNLVASEAATPVVIAIWDSGVDMPLYPGQAWTNAGESRNGLDDDANGFVDDLHGISFSGAALPIRDGLSSLSGLVGEPDRMIDMFAAQLELTAGIDSPRAKALHERLRDMKPTELAAFREDMQLLFFHVHGTHVAGVAVAGNPFARVLSVADSSMAPGLAELADPVAYGRRWAEFCRRNVEYLRVANARIVNMSWANSPSNCRQLLEMFGVGTSPEDRSKLAREMFATMRAGLEDAIRSAPDMLFVTVAGNDDEDVDFTELIPAGLRLPNLVTLGAVDSADRLTSFTNTGTNVQMFANGHLVESLLPRGVRVKWSGTSLAAPQLVNLAAKMLALRPDLTPAQILELVRAHADPVPGRPGSMIINPRKTLEALRHGA